MKTLQLRQASLPPSPHPSLTTQPLPAPPHLERKARMNNPRNPQQNLRNLHQLRPPNNQNLMKRLRLQKQPSHLPRPAQKLDEFSQPPELGEREGVLGNGLDDRACALEDMEEALAGLQGCGIEGGGLARGELRGGLVGAEPLLESVFAGGEDGVGDGGDGFEGVLDDVRVGFVEGEGGDVCRVLGADFESAGLGDAESQARGRELEGCDECGEDGGVMHCWWEDG